MSTPARRSVSDLLSLVCTLRAKDRCGAISYRMVDSAAKHPRTGSTAREQSELAPRHSERKPAGIQRDIARHHNHKSMREQRARCPSSSISIAANGCSLTSTTSLLPSSIGRGARKALVLGRQRLAASQVVMVPHYHSPTTISHEREWSHETDSLKVATSTSQGGICHRLYRLLL